MAERSVMPSQLTTLGSKINIWQPWLSKIVVTVLWCEVWAQILAHAVIAVVLGQTDLARARDERILTLASLQSVSTATVCLSLSSHVVVTYSAAR